MRTRTRHRVRLLSDIKRTPECRALRAVATSRTMRLAAEEAAAEPVLPKEVQGDKSLDSSAEIYLLRGPEAGALLN